MALLKHISLTAALLMGGALGACGDASSSDSPTPAPHEIETVDAQRGNWNIVAEGSFIKFTALQEGKAFTGNFGEFSGVIAFDPDALQDSYVRIEIPLNSVDAGSKDRNSTLPDKIWFSTKAYPAAIYESEEIVARGDGYLAKGMLTLKGESLPVDLSFDLAITGDRAVMTGQTTLDRTRWSVGADPWDTDEWVSKAVDVTVQVTADRR